MKILIVNSFDKGGAANACIRLHLGLIRIGIDSKVLLKNKGNHSIANTFLCQPKPKIHSMFENTRLKFIRILKKLKIVSFKTRFTEYEVFLKKRSSELELFSFPFSNYDITTDPLYQEADLIHLHWVADFLDYQSFFEKNTKPVVWTLHDMNPFTGGEHYEEQFLGIDSFGFPIPRDISKEEKIISKNILKFKYKLFKNIKNITLVTPSKWLFEEAKKSQVFKDKKVIHIPYGLDSTVFNIKDKSLSRDRLSLPKNKKILLFVAESVKNSRKGFEYLKKAFEHLKMDQVILCAVGNNSIELDSHKNLMKLGNISDETQMSYIYSAADAFIIPSLMDNLPNTVLESLMCGTPVIGFPVGGIIDMVEDGRNGLITKEISVSSLSKTIEQFIEGNFIFDRESIRENALSRYDSQVQANTYKDLYLSLLKEVN